MPAKKSYKKRKVTRKVTKKSKYALAWHTNAIARPKVPMVGLGTSCTTVLRTSFFGNVTAVASGIFHGYLKPGSIFDPCGDITTLQPQFYDQFAAVYNRYKVNDCKIRIKIHGNTGCASNGNIWVAAAYPAVDATPLATYQAAASQQYAKTTSGAFQIARLVQGSAYGCGGEGKYLSFDLNHNAVVGAKSDTWDIGATVGNDPTALQYMVLPFLLQANAAGAGAEVPSWVLEIDMWQNVTFSQKKNVVDA